MFFSSIEDEMWLIKYFSDFRFIDPFRRYSRLKSKVVRNRAEFRTFFALPNFVGAPLAKLVSIDHPGLELHPLVKFCEVTPTTPKL